MLERLLALFALLTLIAFVGTVALFVAIPDLIVVSAFVLALAAWDFWPTLRPRKNG